MQKTETIVGLVGNPNSGKTTLFNALTGAHQHVGNWPGVTVEKKSGHFTHEHHRIEIVDLPGTYALDVMGNAISLDEQVARDYVLSKEAGLIVNILDASNLERNLYLTVQLLEMRVPMVIALNMSDVATEKGMDIDIARLQKELGCPVFKLVASRNQGVDELKQYLLKGDFTIPETRPVYPQALVAVVDELQALLGNRPDQNIDPHWIALKALEGDALALNLANQPDETLQRLRAQAEDALGDEVDVAIADARYGFIGNIVQAAVKHKDRLSQTLSDKVDRVVLNRVLGIPIFLFMMYLMFLVTVNLAGVFIDFFDILFGTVLVDGFAYVLDAVGSPEWLTVLLANGIGGGIQTVATFIPPVGFLFLCLSILEDSGYMARAAFVMDRFMRFIGLPGKSFVPLIVGFGCNVPAVMATRTLESERDRLMTMAMTPFMSCGARLPIYVLFAVAFFPSGGRNIVFMLYLIGIGAAMLTGLALKRTLLPGQGTPFIMELPLYHLPTARGVLLHAWERLRSFMWRAGKIIVPMVMVLNILNSVGTDGSFGNEDTEESVLSSIGKGIVPAFTPMGMTEENWPAAVGIFTGVLAKEAVVGTLNALYESVAAAEEGEEAVEEEFDFWGGIGEAFESIVVNTVDLKDSIFDPLGLRDIPSDGDDLEAAAEAQEVSVGTFGAMRDMFPNTAAAFAYLLLLLLYFPCVAVLGAVARETNLRWTAFMAFWSTAFGYCVSVSYYQIATFSQHPGYSSAWLGGIVAFVVAVLLAMRLYAARRADGGRPSSIHELAKES